MKRYGRGINIRTKEKEKEKELLKSKRVEAPILFIRIEEEKLQILNHRGRNFFYIFIIAFQLYNVD